jgi:hypothetical protein
MNTDTAGLCERLRAWPSPQTGADYSVKSIKDQMTEAANTLERQAAEIARLRGTLGYIVRERDRGTGFDRVRQVARAALTGEGHD